MIRRYLPTNYGKIDGNLALISWMTGIFAFFTLILHRYFLWVVFNILIRTKNVSTNIIA
ncbi:hypothetical protein L1283_000302 [Sphingobacterium sp. HSC-15S19]